MMVDTSGIDHPFMFSLGLLVFCILLGFVIAVFVSVGHLLFGSNNRRRLSRAIEALRK